MCFRVICPKKLGKKGRKIYGRKALRVTPSVCICLIGKSDEVFLFIIDDTLLEHCVASLSKTLYPRGA